jgi:transcriptional regulator with XRE-family HTH domain
VAKERGAAGGEPGRAAGRPRPEPKRDGTIPERLNYLWDLVRAPGGKEYSAAEVARRIQCDFGGEISSVYILKILSGERSRPTDQYLEMLARFFEQPLEFFLSPDPPDVDGAAVAGAIVLRSEAVQAMEQQVAKLPARQQQALNDIVDNLLKAERKDTNGSARGGAIATGNEPVRTMLVQAAQLSPRSWQALSDIINSLVDAARKDT